MIFVDKKVSSQMPCEFKLKGYCFHPERASHKLVAANCAYMWIAKMAASPKIKCQESEE